MKKAIETNNGLNGGLLKGKAHYDSNGNSLGGIKAVVTDQGGKPIEVEGNEVIINKKTVASEKVLTVKGTPKEILSTLNQMDGNGVAIGDEEAEILAKYRTGGKIGGSQNKEIERLKNLPYSKFLLEVLDSYKELNAEVGVKGYNQNSGEPIIGYFPNQYEYMYRSDSTGKPIRFFIDLGNEKYIHPFDINPKFNASEQKRIEQKADYFIKDGNENYEKSIKELKDNNELDIVVETLKKALKTFNIENQYDSSDIFKSSGNSILESKDENKRRMKFDIYYFRVNDSELKTNIKNLDLERFKDEYLAKYRTGGSIPREKQIYLGKEGGSNVSPKGMFESAVQMENEGIDSETIRSITGWFRNPFDKLWRFEISDREAKINLSKIVSTIKKVVSSKSEVTLSLKDVYTNNELSKAYGKSIEELPFMFYYDDENEGLGRLNIIPLAGKVFIKLNVYEFLRGNVGEVESTVAERGKLFISFTTHELQHAIQIREGLSAGGSVEQEYRKLLKEHKGVSERKDRAENNRKTREDVLLEQARLNYLNHLGEIEANDSDVRKFFDKKTRIEIPPYSLINFNNEEVIVVPEIKINFREGGELIKRADGSFSRRGLWDNIRDNVGSGRKPTKQMLEQEAKIKEKYHLGGDMTKHLAPNGKPSNLTHEQYHLVRKPEFKAWFGDWENDPENSSKVVDKNGEPLILFQGQAYSKYPKGNYIFDKDNQGIFFTSSKKIANTYGNIIQVFVNARNLKDIRNYYGYDNKKISEDKRNVSRWTSKYKFSELINYVNSDENVVDFYEGIIDKYGDKITINTSREDIVLKDKKALKDFIVPMSPEGFKYVNHTYKSAIWDLVAKYVRASNYDGIICTDEDNNGEDRADTFIVYNSNQVKLADGTNTTFDENNDDIRFAEGGSISRMTPSELKAFYASPEGKKLDAQTYSEWKRLVNMTKSELEKFYNSVEGKKAGLTTSQAKEQGIDSGRESARWVLKMKDIPYKEWSSDMWRWAKKQIGFIKRMTGMRGKLYNDKGEKTRKHTALLIWGHNPEQKFKGGGDVKGYDNFKNPILINGFISNKEIDGKEIFLITYNSGGQEGLNVHQTMNPLAMLDAVEKKTGLHTNTLQVFIYEHTENSNRIETEDELEFLKDNYTVIIVDRDSVEFYNGDNPEEKFAGGGAVGDEVELELYQVRFDTDDDSEIKLVTTDFEDAKYRYDSTTIGDFGDSEFSVSLEKKIDKYKFIYELDEDESIEDYPIEEYYDDSYYYELTEEGEFDNIENRVVESYNYTSNDLLNDVENWAKNKFGNYKYNRIDVYSEDDTNEENDSIGSIQLRIADHSQNESNLPYGIDRSLSVVIANKDATRGRFQQNRPQIYFDGNDSFDYVISEIENYIEDAKEYIQSKKFEKGGRLKRFKGGGELSKKALAVETNDLKDFVRKYFIGDGRIDVSDAMQELFGNKRGKSIAGEYRKRIGLHKKGGLTISQLAHNLWEEHQDEVRGDINDSDFRGAVEDVLISEYGVSSMIKSLMEKSEGGEQDKESEFWMNQFDEGDDEYYEDLSDEEVADYFKDMEGFERELAKGTEHEMEHLDTLKKVAEGKLTPEEGVVQTSLTHIKENPNYYEDLAKMEKENEESIPDLIEGLKVLADSLEGAEKKEIEDVIEGLEILLESDDTEVMETKGYFKQKSDNTSFETVKIINDYFNEWNNVKTDKDINYFKKINPPFFGTYNSVSIIEQIEIFEKIGVPFYANEVLRNTFKKEIKKILLDKLSEKFEQGGEILWATKIGEPDWNEQLITENSSQIENAKKWAVENGFDRIRVSTIDNSKPDFTKGFKKYAEGGEFRMATGGKIVFKPITTPL
jgi:hypothetical protein